MAVADTNAVVSINCGSSDYFEILLAYVLAAYLCSSCGGVLDDPQTGQFYDNAKHIENEIEAIKEELNRDAHSGELCVHKYPTMEFEQLNIGWNAEPNAPNLKVYKKENTVIIEFILNLALNSTKKEKAARIIFTDCVQYRLGPPNDEGFYVHNQSRFKKYGVKWGEFYLVHNSDWQNDFPDEIKLGSKSEHANHYLFYFKNETFECIASSYEFQTV